MAEAMRYAKISVALWSVILCAAEVQGQSWFPTGATWQHEYFNGGAFVGYTRMVADGDTMLGGQQARVLRREIVAAYIAPPHPVQTYPRSPFSVTESEGLVSIWVDSASEYDTLWNMNALPGDRWQLAPMTEPIVCDPESYALVVDTGHTSIADVDLRWLAVDIHYIWDGLEWYLLRDTIVERFGPTLSYFTPHDYCNGQADGADGGPLRCYSDADLSYSRIAPWSCETLLSVADASRPSQARLLRVEGHGCRVELPTTETADLELFDGVGRRLEQLRVSHGDLVQPAVMGFLAYRFTDAAGHILGAGAVVVTDR